jgi:hypothetical protein
MLGKLPSIVQQSQEWRNLIQLNRQLKERMTQETKQLLQTFLTNKVPTTPEPQNGAAQATTAPHSSESPTQSNHVSASSSPLAPSASSSPFKRDESSKLKMPSWCSGIEQDPYKPASEHGLGLVDASVYQHMCGSERNQVQRVWSATADGGSLLAAVLRAEEFQVDSRYEPPPSARVEALRESMQQTASALSDEELAACVPGYDPKETSKEQLLEKLLVSAQGQVDTALLRIYHMLHPTAPRIYVIVGSRAAQPQLSLVVVGSERPQPSTQCIVLFLNVSTESAPHVEVIGWKRGSRGPSPLKTVFDFSENIIRSLETWRQQHASTMPSPQITRNRKRARNETEQASVTEAEE